MAIWFGVDVGGTFSDLIVFNNETGEIVVGKGLTTPDRPDDGIMNVIQQAGTTLLLADASFFMHGTTVGLNTILEGKGATVGLLTTHGFRDVLEIGRGNRAEMFNLFWKPPVPLVPRERRLPIRERVLSNGDVHVDLDTTEVTAAVKTLSEAGIDAVAVVFLNAHVNPQHELAAERSLRASGYEGEISLSHRVSGEHREFERTSTTVIDAYIRPRMGHYLERIEQRLREQGFAGLCLITRSGGGAMTFEEAGARPFETIDSGPVAGVMGAAQLCEQLGITQALTADVGGTSFDTCLITGGRPKVKYEGSVAGRPVQAPWIDVRSVGAGGGSIAHIDPGGLLSVGPQSAGASPGPACYDRRGTEPTVTDAALVLGMLAHGELAGGVKLNLALAQAALEALASTLSLNLDEVARGIVSIANANMANALRQVSVEQGEDPRTAALIAYGGAGPLFGTLLAAELEISQVVVPPYAGNFSAWGLLTQDITRSAARTVWTGLDDEGVASGEAVLRELFADLDRRSRLGSELDDIAPVHEAAFDIRYAGQEYTLTVPIVWREGNLASTVSEIRNMFSEQYRRTYGHAMDAAVELVSARATTRLPLPRQAAANSNSSGHQAYGSLADGHHVSAFSFTKNTRIPFTVLNRQDLAPKTRLQGPIIILEATTTTFVDAGFELYVHPAGAMILTVTESQ